MPCIAFLAAVSAGALVADAQVKKKAPAAKAEETEKKPDPAAAERAYAAGTKAFASEQYGEAIEQLSQALSGGGLPPQQMAKAMLTRGMAYRKEGKPAQAISDLTTAAWLKGGLSESERTQALEQRQLAYVEAGLGNSPPPIGAPPLDAPASSAPAATTTPGVIASAPVQSSSFWDSLLPWGGSSSPAPKKEEAPAAAPEQTAAAPTPPAETAAAAATDGAAAPPPVEVAAASAAPAPVPSAPAPASVADLTTASLSGAVQAPYTATAPAPPPETPTDTAATSEAAAALAGAPEAAPAQTSDPITTAGNSVGSFFSNLFTPSPSVASTAAPPGGTSPETATALTTGSTATGPGASTGLGWSEGTVVAAQAAEPPAGEALPWASPDPPAAAAAPAAPVTAPAPKAEKNVAAAPAPPAPTPSAPERTATAASGSYSLQVASVRSREEAERLVASLKKYQALYKGSVSPAIDETVVGSMGTFYRVRLGPYADATEPGQLCKSLKPQGFDCLVLTQ